MKKLNNKGFAISTLLYGLMLVAFLVVSLLMSIMSTNRKNTSTLIKKIEEELNRYSQTATELSSTDGAQEFIVPYGKAGWYKIELWGAAAYNVDTVNETESKRGAYTSGIIYLEENQHLYFQIGTAGTGNSSASTNNTYDYYAGGATDVRLVGGNWDNTDGLNSRIMVAAGGGYSSTKKGTGYGGYYSIKYDGGSYISGYPGLEANTSYYFLNPVMFLGVNDGDGKAKIELVSTSSKDNPPAQKISYLNNVRYIKSCIRQKTTALTTEAWREIQAIDSTGVNRAKNITVSYGSSFNITTGTVSGLTDGSLDVIEGTLTSSLPTSCITLDLGAEYNLEEITVFHNKPATSTELSNYAAEVLAVAGNSASYTELRDSMGITATPIETFMGLRYSARNPESLNLSGVIATGNYYIVSALSDNRMVTIVGEDAQLKLFSGAKTQRWGITHVGNNEYKILDGANQYALQPQDGGQEVGEYITNHTKYNEHAWEKWKIYQTPSANTGYYMFEVAVEGETSLCMASVSTARDTSGLVALKECNSNDTSQWFKLINADY